MRLLSTPLSALRPGAVRSVVIVGAFVTLAGCGGLDRNGQFRDNPLENFEQKVIGGALASAGIIAPQREKILYTPRAPLALPPPQAVSKLRPPQDTQEILTASANWPLDPDELRRQRLASQRANSVAEQFSDEQKKRLSIEEIEAGRGVSTPGSVADSDQKFDRGSVVISREELERGWSPLTPGQGLFSLFEVDETVDVREKVRAESAGQAKDYLDQQNGANTSFEGTLDRVDTSRLSSQAAPTRRSIVDPPVALRVPAPDPASEAAVAVAGSARNEDRPWWAYVLAPLSSNGQTGRPAATAAADDRPWWQRILNGG